MQLLQMKPQAADSMVNPVAASEPSAALLQGLAGWFFRAITALLKMRATDAPRRSRRQLRVVETLQLGGRRQILLVSCHGERFLVGAGAEAIQTMVRVRSESRDEGSAATQSARTDIAELTW